MTRDRKVKFKELAEHRVNRAIYELRLIGNLADKSNYSYDDVQVNKIISTLVAEIKTLKIRFQNSGSKAKSFKLS